MEDLLLDNYYMKKGPQMPPEPATVPKDSSSYNEFIQSHFTQQQIEQLNQKQRAQEQEAEARLR